MEPETPPLGLNSSSILDPDPDQPGFGKRNAHIFQTFLIVVMTIYILIKRMKYYKVPENFPPGPPCVPFLGVLPFIKGDFKAALQEWREEYGDIVGLKLGSELAVVISDFSTVSTAFNDERCAGRPRNLRKIMHAFFASSSREESSKMIFFSHKKDESSTPTFASSGIVFAHGKDWVEQRRFSLKALRDRGFGKTAMESIVMEEVEKFREWVMKRLNEENYESKKSSEKTRINQNNNNGNNCKKEYSSFDLNGDMSIAVVNSLWAILTGEKIAHGDKRVWDVVAGTGHFIRRESLLGAVMVFPWLRHLPLISKQFNRSKSVGPLKMRKLQDDMVAIKQKRRASRLESVTEYSSEMFDSGGQSDYIDEYLNKVEGCRNRKSSFFGDRGVVNLQRSLTDLFGAGSETTTTTILFSFLYMIKYPQIQEKVQQEIDEICGNRSVMLADKPLMPYTEATVNEVLRHSCLVYTIPHSTTDDLELDGYALPRDTAIYANMWAILRDPEYWEEADVFKPERFIDEFGSYKADERNIPFMLGKRVCIGQNVARNTIFLFFTGILQQFQLVAPDGPESVKIDPIVGFIHYCPAYNVKMIPRAKGPGQEIEE